MEFVLGLTIIFSFSIFFLSSSFLHLFKVFLRVGAYNSSIFLGKIFGNLSSFASLHDEWFKETYKIYSRCLASGFDLCNTICRLHHRQLYRVSARCYFITRYIIHSSLSCLTIDFFIPFIRRSESGRYSEDSAVCAMLLENMPDFPLYELSCLIFFLIPMVFIVVLYVRMCLRIQRNTLGRSIEGSVHGETRQAHSRKAIVRMLSK